MPDARATAINRAGQIVGDFPQGSETHAFLWDAGVVTDLGDNQWRGHSPVLPLSTRIDALTDRLAFFCDQLGVSV